MVQPSIASLVNTAMEHLPYLDSQATEEHLNIKDLANQNILDILGDYLTPRGDKVSPACQRSGEYYKQMLAAQEPWAMQMFDADPKFLQAGLMEGNFISFPGAFDSCLKADSGDFLGKYCLMGLYVPEEEK